MTAIYVDSDACPVKPEVMRVAKRYGLSVTFVSNSWFRLPEDWEAKLVVVDGQYDAADDWIVEHVAKDDVISPAPRNTCKRSRVAKIFPIFSSE